MEDKAQEISVTCWRWYKAFLSVEPKTDEVWDEMMLAANQYAQKYKDDSLNYPLVQDMFLAFSDHVGRLQKAGGGKNE